jgi:dienelactone hydrolase
MLELRPISYGAPYVCDQLSDKGICSAGAFAHPAFLKEHHFENLKSESPQPAIRIKNQHRLSDPETIAQLKDPLLLSCSQHDSTFPKESRRRAVDIMDEREHKYQVQVFQGVQHGFALRGDMSDPWQKHCKDQSFEGIVEFFNVHLK